jgi:serine/threonine protein kinase
VRVERLGAVATSPDGEARFRAEVDAFGSVLSESIVALLDSGIEGADAFVVTEPPVLPTLRGLVSERGTLPFGAAVTAFVGLVRGLRMLHEVGVVHGFLAPDSFHFRSSGRREILVLHELGIGALPGGEIGAEALLVDLRGDHEAGASALELNLYTLPTDPSAGAAEVERGERELVSAVCAAAGVPVAVKLSPFYSSLPAFLADVEAAGAKGAILFNRFYQADIDVDALELARELHLSTRGELLLRLRWLAIASPRTGLSLACSGGVHMTEDVVKAVMSGAHVVQVVSALLEHGPTHLADLLAGFNQWGDDHGYESVDELRGCMNLARCPDPAAYERANYIHLLQGWHG